VVQGLPSLCETLNSSPALRKNPQRDRTSKLETSGGLFPLYDAPYTLLFLPIPLTHVGLRHEREMNLSCVKSLRM
jgi:hypothetical protein